MVVVVMVLVWFPVVCTMDRICVLDVVIFAVILADPVVIVVTAIAIVAVTTAWMPVMAVCVVVRIVAISDIIA